MFYGHLILNARRLERVESLKARERQGERNNLTSDRNLTQVARTDEIIAEKLDFGSRDTYRKEKFIVENQSSLTPEEFAEWDEGKLKRVATLFTPLIEISSTL